MDLHYYAYEFWSTGLMVPRWTGPLWKPPLMFRQIAEFRFLEKTNFLWFGGPKKLFWAHKTLFGFRNPTLRGVILLKLYDPSYGFRATDGKIAIFWHNQPWKSPKPWIRSKSFRSTTPPKVGSLRLNKVLGAQKKFFGTPKTRKIDFLKKPEFRDLSEHWRWFPQWPWSPGYHQTS